MLCDRVEHSRRLYRLREFRRRGILRGRRLHVGGAAQGVDLPLPATIVAAGWSAAWSVGDGYLTLRLKGVFFAIATLAMAIVIETLVNNWYYVGGATGYYMLAPETPLGRQLHPDLFTMMLVLTLAAGPSRACSRGSRLGRGLAAIRDDEVAAECSGVPTLRLKLMPATVMGGLMGMAGAPFPYYITYLDPPSAFSLAYRGQHGRNAGDRRHAHWIGPVIGAVIVGTAPQRLATVRNLVGALDERAARRDCFPVPLLIIAPNGIVA